MTLRTRLLILFVSFASLVALPAALISRAVMFSWLERDLELRANLAAEGVTTHLGDALAGGSPKSAAEHLEQITRDPRVIAAAVCLDRPVPRHIAGTLPPDFRCPDIKEVRAAFRRGELIRVSGTGVLHVTFHPITGSTETKAPPAGPLADPRSLVLFQDADYLYSRLWRVTAYTFFFAFVIVAACGLMGLLFARFALKDWLGPRGRRGRLDSDDLNGSPPGELAISSDLGYFIHDVNRERSYVDGPSTIWAPDVLRGILANRLSGEQIIVVSNREPYSHVRTNGSIAIRVPPSGVVTALEPIVKACSGTWVAHGNGDADLDVVDAHSRVLVPPGEESYALRRVWLTAEEEEGYYYGFANEGLWPLCHIAHTRPIFRPTDWEAYRVANQKFADAVVDEAKADNPIVLIQDYHFALLPRLLRERLPRSTLILFWHIPWPNPEAFGICPWRNEILDGLLGSTIIGFHTRYHRNNFLDTLDRYLECRIDREHSAVSYQGQQCLTRSYPISIEWPPRFLAAVPPVDECRSLVRARHGLPSQTKIFLGVERLDYTKGLTERLAAYERVLEQNEHLRGQLTMIQIAAPSRSKLPAYRALALELEETVRRIGERYSTPACPAIIFLDQHHEPSQVAEYLRACDVCLVTSLHDGMNLVAKEFVAVRDDEQGVLVLSTFTGASRELPEALVVNPYHVEQLAEALITAINMSSAEQQLRMRNMREQVREFNVYRWAGRMLIDAARIRERHRINELVGSDEEYGLDMA